MAPSTKFYGERLSTPLPGAAANTTVITPFFTYDFNYLAYGAYDFTQMVINRATYLPSTSVTGSATGYNVNLLRYTSAGVLVTTSTFAFSNGVNAAAFQAIDMTPNLNPLSGWALNPGDNVVVSITPIGTGTVVCPTSAVTVVLAPQGA